jgi:alkylation response protein AidB-like acyl-CoA dehydrogenase
MTADELRHRFRNVTLEELPLPASGYTSRRHRRLMELGRESLSLARLAEAHFDAVAILAEAGRTPTPSALYGVWAAEIPGKSLRLNDASGRLLISGTKMFCSGAGIIDRALLTVGAPDPYLIEIDVHSSRDFMRIDHSPWKTSAFALTGTATVTFDNVPVNRESVLKGPGWYLSRAGFWHGACGPAACWAGGAIGLVDYARQQSRSDAHTLAHLGALHALQWQMESCLEIAGRQIDALPEHAVEARIRSLTVRHLIEQACTEVLRRFARSYGPHPLAFVEPVSTRYQELDLYLRQCHAERDLEALGHSVQETRSACTS